MQIIKKPQRAKLERRSECMDDDQLRLEVLDEHVGRIEADRPVVIAESDAGPPKRSSLPDHLPRDTQVLVGGYCDYARSGSKWRNRATGQPARSADLAVM